LSPLFVSPTSSWNEIYGSSVICVRLLVSCCKCLRKSSSLLHSAIISSLLRSTGRYELSLVSTFVAEVFLRRQLNASTSVRKVTAMVSDRVSKDGFDSFSVASWFWRKLTILTAFSSSFLWLKPSSSPMFYFHQVWRTACLQRSRNRFNFFFICFTS